MKRVVVVTDSNAALPERLVQELDIRVVPVLLHLDGHSFRDGVDLAPGEFYRLLRSDVIATLKEDRQRKRNQLAAGLTSPPLRRSIQKTLDFLNQEIELLEKELHELLSQDPDKAQQIELLCSIPGIGRLTACRFLAEVDVTRFRQASHLAAYAGLVPTEHTSGASSQLYQRISDQQHHLSSSSFCRQEILV